MKNWALKYCLFIFCFSLTNNNFFAQIGIGPAPYCMPLYSQIPCNQPNPSNTPGNGINDFINSFSTVGGVSNITNNNSGCNAQNLQRLALPLLITLRLGGWIQLKN